MRPIVQRGRNVAATAEGFLAAVSMSACRPVSQGNRTLLFQTSERLPLLLRIAVASSFMFGFFIGPLMLVALLHVP